MPASMTHVTAQTPMGANLVDGGATFRVWAPGALEVHIVGDFNAWTRGPATLLNRDANGYWAGFVPGVRELQEYKYFVVGRGSSGFKRDPYARELTADWPESNCIIRSTQFPWNDQAFRTPEFRNFVIYQLHVGTFYAPAWPRRVGTFLDVAGKVEHLSELGITCVQLLPIIEFMTRFSMGYNGTDYYSPEMDFAVSDADLDPYVATVNRLLRQKSQPEVGGQSLHGPANQLKMLVNLCHLYGMAVVFDVVFNHAGGDFDDQSIYFFDRDLPGDQNRSLYFTDHGHAGGLVFAFWKKEVRQFLIDNAGYFLREYHADGFRYDQVSVIVQENNQDGWPFCQDLTRSTHAIKPEAIDHAEYWPVDPYIVKEPGEGGAGFDTTLHDGLRDAIRGVIAQASIPGSGPLAMGNIAAHLRAGGFDASWQAVQCIENHDEVYRERGKRVPALADGLDARSWFARSRSRTALGLLLFAPGLPMLFMGQEFLEADQWADDIQNHPELLLNWAGLRGGDRSMEDFLRFTREAVAARFAHPALRGEGTSVIHVHDENRVLAFHRWVPNEGKDVVVVASLNDSTFVAYEIGMPVAGSWREVFNSDVYDHWVNPWATGNGGRIDAESTPRHGMPASARLVIPANSILILSRE